MVCTEKVFICYILQDSIVEFSGEVDNLHNLLRILGVKILKSVDF